MLLIWPRNEYALSTNPYLIIESQGDDGANHSESYKRSQEQRATFRQDSKVVVVL